MAPEERFLISKSLLEMAISEKGGMILQYFFTHQFATVETLSEKLGYSTQIIDHHIKTLRRNGVVKSYGAVGDKRLPQPARKTILWGLVEGDPKNAIIARSAYLELFRNRVESPTMDFDAIEREDAKRQAREQLQGKEEMVKSLFAEYCKGKNPPFRHRDFRDWIKNFKHEEFQCAKDYADIGFRLGLVVA